MFSLPKKVRKKKKKKKRRGLPSLCDQLSRNDLVDPNEEGEGYCKKKEKEKKRKILDHQKKINE